MKEIKQSARSRENGVTKIEFWGTIALSVITLLICSYFFSVVLRQTRTPVTYAAMTLFLSSITIAITGIVLNISRRRDLALKLTFYTLFVIGFTAASLFQGRTLSASLSILLISAMVIRWLFPSHTRRWYSAVTAVALVLMWVIEWINPPWRIQLEAARLGPVAVVVFALILGWILFSHSRKYVATSLRFKLVVPFVVGSLILAVLTVYIGYRNQLRNAEEQAVQQAQAALAQTLATRKVYTDNVVGKLRTDGFEIVPSTSFIDVKGGIPLPATFVHLISDRVNEQNLYHLDLISPWPINPEKGPKPGWQESAIAKLINNPQSNQFTVETVEGESRLLFMGTDFAVDETCVSCHNAHPDSPKTDFKVGDMMGALVIEVPLTNTFAAAGTQAVTTSLGVLVGLLGLVAGMVLLQQRVVVQPMEQLVQASQQISSGDLSTQVEVKSNDEMGTLARSFNAMTTRLRQTLEGLEQTVAERTHSLELASEVGRSVSQVRSLDVMLKDAAEIIRSRFDLYYVQVYLTDASQTNLLLLSGTGKVGAELLGRGHRLPLNVGSINGRAATEKKSVIITDTTASSTFRPNPLLPDTRSEMAIPLLVGEKVVGVLDLQSEKANGLNQDLRSAFEALAGQLAIAIQNANLLAEAEQARAEVEKQTRRLVRANWADYLDAIHKPEETGFVFEQNKIMPLTQAEATQSVEKGNSLAAPIEVTGEALGNLVVEMDEGSSVARSDELVNTVARQVAQHLEALRLLESAERYRAEAEEASRRLTREGWKTYVENAEESLGYFYDLKEVKPHDGNGHDESAVALPLKVRDEVLGKLTIQGLDANDNQALELVNAVAERLSAHIESLRQFDETKRGQVALDRRAQQLAAVAEISTASSKELDIQEMLESVVNLTQRKFGLYHAHIFTYNEYTDELQIVACGWQEGDQHEGTHETVSIPLSREQSLVARAARTKQAVIVNDVKSEEGFLPNPLLPDTASEMAVPLIIGDQMLGVLDVQSDRINAFSEEDANIQTTLASQVATALQNARSFARAQQQAARESTLNVISQKIQSATSVEAVLQIAARELGHALGAPMTVAQLSMKDKS